ncbi:phosphoribosylanthranilate isomerase [Bombella sp. TMW 2.2559]|uniref:N-(5'-phosphoribosyl)anthranilate isomerase n=1 Tax=Bombella dulcis TaxID=2967339 RepID=A0ABT3WD32_9PROT|nr:phosphoribosylanthranilate isomerase [Bombella dulcis]MCX5615719.1 phosphoribosylanthranilate isomerase [Bombella dulcis]
MTVSVKICGLTRTEDMQACAALGVRWVGLVFHLASPRFVKLEQAADLHAAIPVPNEGGPLRVGLFVKPTHEQIAETLRHVPLDILQLYTDEATALTLQARTGRPVWLARGISRTHDLPVSDALDGYVIEAPAQEGDTRPGGLGRIFDWTLTSGWQAPAPWLLAGGLTPENVADAVRTSQTRAVDVSSGVEERPGIKSALLIEKFVKNSQKGACTH